jgi:hypothetical protein
MFWEREDGVFWGVAKRNKRDLFGTNGASDSLLVFETMGDFAVGPEKCSLSQHTI